MISGKNKGIHTSADSVIIKAAGNRQPITSWTLNIIDKSSFQWVLRGTWLFRGKPDVKRMKAGLAELLGYYPHLCGRMVNRSALIQLNNAGVPFVFAHTPELTLEYVSGRADEAGMYSNSISIGRLKAGLEAPLSIKLTQLADGYVLGVSSSHTCLDGMAFYSMVNNWGRLCRGENIEAPVLDQTLLAPRSSRSREEVLADINRLGWKKLSILKLIRMLAVLTPRKALMRTAAFHFPAGALAELKEILSGAAGCRLTTNEVLCAFLTRMFMRLFRYSGADSCSQATVVNMRNRLPDIPETFAGNAAFILVSARAHAEEETGEIARAVHQGLAPFVEKPSPALQQLMSLNLEAMQHRIPFFPFDVTTMHRKKPTTVYINNFSRLPVYTVDFGDGVPVKVFPHNLGDPVVIWPAPAEQGGVEVYFGGIAACAVNKLRADDPWLAEMRRFS